MASGSKAAAMANGSKAGINAARLAQLQAPALRERHEKAFARIRDRWLRGCGPLRIALWVVAFPPLLLVALLNLPLVLFYVLVVTYIPGCLCTKRRKTEDLDDWMCKEAPAGIACYPNPCLCWPACCWYRSARTDALPDFFRGVFWMEGNKIEEDFLNFVGGCWNEDTRTMRKRLYDPGGWTNPATLSGTVSYWITRLFRMEMDAVFDEGLRDAYLQVRFFGLEAPYCMSGMTLHRGVDDGSIWFRKNHNGYGEYCAVRIVNADGSNTEVFAEMMAHTAEEVATGSRRVALEQYTGTYCCTCRAPGSVHPGRVVNDPVVSVAGPDFEPCSAGSAA